MDFIKATKPYITKLRSIAYYSEKHWGYSDSFMKIFEEEFNITEEFVEKYPTYMGVENSCPVCFWGMINSENTYELEFFYVDEEKLGCGYGRIMWEQMMEWCRSHGVKKFVFVTSPQAVGFYERMGAEVSGSAHSTIDGREIPRLIYYLEEEAF